MDGLLRSLRPAALALAGALLVASAAGGCKSCEHENAGGDDAGHAQPTSLTPEQAKQVLVRFADGETITLGDYAAALEHMDQFNRLRYQSAERRKELLDEMINIRLLAKEAEAKGYDKDPLTQEELRAILRDSMLQEARKGAPTPAEIPEQEVRAWFEAHRAEYKDPERRRLSLVVLADEATAREVLAAAKKAPGAAQWGELVRAKSVDPLARNNVPVDLAGDFGIVAPPGDTRGENTRVPDEVRAGVFEVAEVGGVLDRVVAAKGKFYVVRLTQKLPAHERTYEEAERTIRVKLAQDKLRAKEEQLLAELRKTIKVEVDEAAIASAKVDIGDGGGPASAYDAAPSHAEAGASAPR
ncbi:MAG: peptidyl-prolyl cis-trans isomerase [Deltaproteobacteria bacterium]|nr:peptidyl-prolyl cis-trans isomerase [Deltaproteobacteria bacterium]